jgi:hypothetical protein
VFNLSASGSRNWLSLLQSGCSPLVVFVFLVPIQQSNLIVSVPSLRKYGEDTGQRDNVLISFLVIYYPLGYYRFGWMLTSGG